MTTASAIITAGYRESQLIAIVSTPSVNEQTEALALLNQITLSAIGFEAGGELSDLNVGGQYDQSAYCSTWIPPNARLVLNLSGATTLRLDPQPYEGQRFAVADAGGSLAALNLTLDGNGRTIDGSTTSVLSTNGYSAQWIYRADIADWTRLTDRALADEMPFPSEFDSYFVTRLAMRLNPRNRSQALAAETVAELQKIEGKLRARYRKPRRVQDMPRGFLGARGGLGTQADFNAGRTWR